MSPGLQLYTAAVQALAALGTIGAAVAAWRSASAASRTASDAERTARRATEALGRAIRPYLTVHLLPEEGQDNRGPGPVRVAAHFNNRSDWECGAWELKLTPAGSAVRAQTLAGDSVPAAGDGPMSRSLGEVGRVAQHPAPPGTTGDRPEDRRRLASYVLRYRDGRGAVEWTTRGEFVERQMAAAIPPDPGEPENPHRPHYIYDTEITQEPYPDTSDGPASSPRLGPNAWRRGVRQRGSSS